MKKSIKIAATLFSATMLFANAAFAKGITLSGTTDPDSYGVAVLVTEKGKDVHTLKAEDVVWISQHNIDQNGNFIISLPIFDEAAYDMYSSAGNFSTNEETLKVYVASNPGGNQSGFDAQNPTTLSEAFKSISSVDEIIITDNITYENIPVPYYGNLKISGLTGSEVVTLPETVSLNGNLAIDNLILKTQSSIYANGYSLIIGENVTSDRMHVYGGSNGVACANTDIKIYGGQYADIYGGGNNGGTVTGNTNVVLGGNANPGYEITSEASAELKCNVLGGGRFSKVNGSTNITLEGNAIANYLVGSGVGTGAVVSETHININGGKVMNVYGGSKDVPLTNCNTYITMTAGIAESLFGGCESASMSGNTYITVKGGEVLRRIYGGCYNNHTGLSWSSTDYSVNGTTNVFLYPEASLITGTGLTHDNKINSGIFATSRRQNSSANETGSIFFMDGSYSKFKSKVAEQTSFYKNTFKSFHIYTVDSAIGGSVSPDGAGNVTVITTNGKTALTGGKRYMNGQKISLTANAVTSIVYDGIDSADIYGNQAQVGVTSSVEAELYASVYDESGSLIFAGLTKVNPGTDNYEVDINCNFEANKKYQVKLFLWDGKAKLVPIAGTYIIEVKK